MQAADRRRPQLTDPDDGPDPNKDRGVEGEWERHLVRTKLRRRVEAVKYLGGSACVVALWATARWGVVARRPLWLVVLVVAGEALTAWAVDTRHQRAPSALTDQLRVAVPAVGITLVIFLIGWGPALAIGYVFPMLSMSFEGSARRVVPVAVWSIAALAAGQVLVATGTVHLLIDTRTSWALTVIGAIALGLVAVVIAQIAAGKASVDRELAWAASHDQLTGLMNRSAFTGSLDRLVINCRRGQRPVAVLFCDLLGFKDVNDRLGHDAGDLALREVARRMATCVRGEDLVARFGGDEFVVALVAPGRTTEAIAVADRILERIQEPIEVTGVMVTVGCSVGIAFCATGATESDSLLSEADAAMYEAKAIAVPARVLHAVA
jgi:diguanylate cyclase (GGDEF)-like protein